MKAYETGIDHAIAQGAGDRAFLLGMGKGLASLGSTVVGGLNTTSNLLARNLYDGATYDHAQREIEANEQAVSQAIETAHRTAQVIQEDPSGAAAAIGSAAIGYAGDVAMLEPRALAGLGEFVGQAFLPAGSAKGLKVAEESLSAARDAMRLGDGFFDAGMVDDLGEMSRARVALPILHRSALTNSREPGVRLRHWRTCRPSIRTREFSRRCICEQRMASERSIH